MTEAEKLDSLLEELRRLEHRMQEGTKASLSREEANTISRILAIGARLRRADIVACKQQGKAPPRIKAKWGVSIRHIENIIAQKEF